MLTGIAGDTGQYWAFIEDQATLKTTFMKAGDSIARGRIKTVAFDHLDYEHGSRLTRVDIGQNLRGELATPSGSLPPSSPGSDSPGIATGAPGSAAPAASPASVTGGSTDDIAEKLRRRRAAEGTGR